jgi:hypothetical protein
MRARRSARYRAIRALAYVLGSWTVAAAAVPVDLEGAAGTAWSEAQTRQTHSIIENSPVYKDLLAETKQLFAQPSFSEYTPFPIVRLYGDTVYGFDEHGFYSTTWRRFLASALPKNPAFLMSTMAAVQSGVRFPRPWENLQCLPLAPARRLIMKGEKSPFESKTTAPQRAHCVGYRGPDICEGRDGDDPDTAQQDRPGGGGGYRVPLEGDGAAPAALVEGRETYGRGSISQACRP